MNTLDFNEELSKFILEAVRENADVLEYPIEGKGFLIIHEGYLISKTCVEWPAVGAYFRIWTTNEAKSNFYQTDYFYKINWTDELKSFLLDLDKMGKL